MMSRRRAAPRWPHLPTCCRDAASSSTALALFTAASLVSGSRRQPRSAHRRPRRPGRSAAALAHALGTVADHDQYAGAQRKTALALWGAVGSLGVAAGVLLGGGTDHAGPAGRPSSWVNVPIGVVALLVADVASTRQGCRQPAPGLRDFDFPGAIAVIGGLTTLVYGALRHSSPRLVVGPDRRSLSLCRAVSAAAFLTRRAPGRQAAVPARTSGSSRRWCPAPSVMLGVTGILVGAVFLTSIFLQTALGFSPLESGLAFLPFALAPSPPAPWSPRTPPATSPACHRHRRPAESCVVASLLALHRRRCAAHYADILSRPVRARCSASAWCSSRCR